MMKPGRITILAITVTLILGVICALWVLSRVELEDELSFSFVADGREEGISCWKNTEGGYEVFLPGHVEMGQLKACVSERSTISINETEIYDGISCDIFVLNVPYEVTLSTRDATIKTSITFRRSENVASVHIDTESQSLEYLHASKENKEAGTIRVYTNQGMLQYAGDLEHITGRGNSTWLAAEKKSYGIKLTQEVDLLTMGAAQKWVLLANAFDESNLKNKLVYDFAAAVDLPFSPDCQWVDLYLNNEYVGLYLLCEKIEVHPERVNVANEGSSLVSMEYESRLISQGLPYAKTDAQQALRIHYPEKPTQQDLSSSAKLWQSVENAIISEDGIDAVTGKTWKELIDVDSWARKYLIEEIFGNLDAAFISQYFYIDGSDSNGKAYAGPVWDFDSSFTSLWQTSAPNAWCANRLEVEDGYDAPWFYMLCQKPEFMERVTKLYKEEFLPLLQEMSNETIQSYANQIRAAALMNSIRWNTEGDMDVFVLEMETYLSERTKFLSDVWIEGTEYVRVKAFPEYGGHYAYFGIQKGATLASLPDMSNVAAFAGWYYSDTNMPIDQETPVLQDIQIYSKWNEVSKRAESRIKQLMPLGIIAVMGVGILGIDIWHYKAGKGRK